MSRLFVLGRAAKDAVELSAAAFGAYLLRNLQLPPHA